MEILHVHSHKDKDSTSCSWSSNPETDSLRFCQITLSLLNCNSGVLIWVCLFFILDPYEISSHVFLSLIVVYLFLGKRMIVKYIHIYYTNGVHLFSNFLVFQKDTLTPTGYPEILLPRILNYSNSPKKRRVVVLVYIRKEPLVGSPSLFEDCDYSKTHSDPLLPLIGYVP